MLCESHLLYTKYNPKFVLLVLLKSIIMEYALITGFVLHCGEFLERKLFQCTELMLTVIQFKK